MAEITLTIDDQILADFYNAVGANPLEKWTVEEKDLWLRINFLEPYILKRLIEEGRYARKQVAENAIMEEYKIAEKIVDDKLAEAIAKRQLDLPPTIKEAEIIEPVIEGVVKASATKR